MIQVNEPLTVQEAPASYQVILDSQHVRQGYKQSEVGVIPEDWDVKTLANVAPLQRGFDLPTTQLHKGLYPVVYSNGVLNFHNKAMVVAPGVVTGRSGTIGKVNYIESDYWPHNTTLWVTSFKNNETKFIYYLYQDIKLERFGTGSGVPTLNRNDVHAFRVAVPPSPEQRAIATALSDVDVLLAAQDKLIAKKRDIKQATMQQLLTGKQRLPGFTGEWEVKRLGDVGEIVTGSTPPTQIKEYWNGSIPWITPTDISDKKDMFSSEREITLLGLQAIRKLPANSLLVTCIASIGKNAILRKNGACNQQINAIIPNNNNSVDFFYYLVENSKSYLLGNAGITATLMISKKDFSEISFSLPLKEEQNAIATILSDMDADITALEQQRDKTQALKQGMMQQLLTGKIRLI